MPLIPASNDLGSGSMYTLNLPFRHCIFIACWPGSTPSSILVGMPPPYPWDAVASIRAIFALWDSALAVCGERFSWLSVDFWVPRCSLAAATTTDCAGDPDCLSLCWDEVRGDTRPFCNDGQQQHP